MEARFKFRAWESRGELGIGVMHYFDLFDASADMFDQGMLGHVLVEDLSTMKIMQCTGLKDKNGKLIYEGDIVKSIENKFTAAVFWRGDWAAFCNNAFSGECVGPASPETVEIIGNIYENPELLK